MIVYIKLEYLIQNQCLLNIGTVSIGRRYTVTIGTVPMGCILSLMTVLTVVLTELTNVIFIPFESDLKLLVYGQLSPGEVVTLVVLPDENNFVFLYHLNPT